MRHLFTIASFFLMTAVTAPAQEIWTNYGRENVITDIAIRGDYIWCATTNGLVRWDKRDMSYRKFTMGDGLPHSVVNSVAIAPDGAVWCGTVGGVARFDGISWRVFTSKDGLPDTSVRSTVVGPDGTVWCGTYYYGSYILMSGHGLSRYDGGSWTTFTFNSSDVMYKDQVGDIAVLSDSTVWASNCKGVFRFDGKEMKLVYSSSGMMVYNAPSGMNLLSAEPDNTLWVLNESTILNTRTMSTVSFSAFSGGKGGTSILNRSDGSLWVGTANGALRYDGSSWTKYTVVDGLGDNSVTSLAEDGSGILWLGTNNGLTRFDGTSFSAYRTDDELIGDSVSSIAFDRNGFVWVGSEAGVFRYNGKNWRSFTTENGLPDNGILSLAVTSSGEVWAGTSKGAAHFIGSGWKTYTRVEGLPDNNVTSMVSGAENTVWAGTAQGLAMFDGSSWKTFSEPGNSIKYLASTSDGTIWCSDGSTIYRFRGNAWNKFPVCRPEGFRYGDYAITSFFGGPGGTLYYIKSKCTDVHSYSFINHICTLPDSSAFPSSIPLCDCFAVSADSTQWYGQNFKFHGMSNSFFGGVFRIRNSETVRLFDSDGLVNLGVRTIAIAPDGGVWFGTDKGLSRYGKPLSIGVESEPALPKEFAVVSNYPNPFNPSTTISFTLPQSARVELSIYSITGQRVRTLFSGSMEAGTRSAVWDGRDYSGRPVSSGIYIAQLKSGKQAAGLRLTLLR